MADQDRWDEERYERDDGRRREAGPPRHERAYEEGGFEHRPRIGPTGIMNNTSPSGQWATTGRYMEDYQARADYGGYEGGPPQLGPGSSGGGGRRYAGAGREPPPNPGRGRARLAEQEREIGGPYTDYGRAAGPYADYGRETGSYGAGGGYTPAPAEGVGREARSWRPEQEMRGEHRGRGPKGYKRSDERIHEDVNDRLTDDPMIDATEIEVLVAGAEVSLNGTVESRAAKRRAEDVAESVTGVGHVQNNLRIVQKARPGTLGAETDPRLAAIAEGRDPDDGPRHMRPDEERRDQPTQRLEEQRPEEQRR